MYIAFKSSMKLQGVVYHTGKVYWTKSVEKVSDAELTKLVRQEVERVSGIHVDEVTILPKRITMEITHRLPEPAKEQPKK